MVFHSYKLVVLECLNKKTYPILYDHVVIIIYYKWIEPSRLTKTRIIENSIYHLPEIIYEKENKPFKLLYFQEGNTNTVACELEKFDIYEDCTLHDNRKYVRLRRNDISDYLKIPCKSFEEEIYLFIKYLNTDVSKIAKLLDLNFQKSTRFIPISFKMCVEKFYENPIDSSCKLINDARYFGFFSNSDELSTREVNGNISASMAKDIILSLNDDKNWQNIKTQFPAEICHREPYTLYYSVRWQTIFPLAYNPLENPIISV